MKRKVIFCMIIAMTICSCSKKQNDLTVFEKNDLTLFEVSGKVKSIRQIGYYATEKLGMVFEGDVLCEEWLNYLAKFNEDGYNTEVLYYSFNGDFAGKTVFVLDNDNKREKIIEFDRSGNENGKTITAYNENGNPTKIVTYNGSGEVSFVCKNEWDGDNCIKTQETRYIDGDSIVVYKVNEYKGGSLVKSVSYDKNGKKTGSYTEYENDKITKIVKPDYTITATYNEKGLCSSIENGNYYLRNDIDWAYGSFTYEYEYDDKGNWIRKIEHNMHTELQDRVFVREIEYY